MLTLREYLLLILAVAFASYSIWLHHAGEVEAQQREEKAAQAQALKDARTNQVAIDDLNAEVSKLRADALQPVPVVRVRNACQVPTPTVASGAKPAAPAPRDVPEVSTGASGGPDIGPGLQRLAIAADLLSAHNRALLERDKK